MRLPLRRIGLLGTALAVLAAVLVVAGSATALNGNRTGPHGPRGFPRYYVDTAGKALQLCDDRSVFCLRTRPRALRPPGGEALYWGAISAVHSRRGTIAVEYALEAAFEGRRPIVFSRIRVRGHLNRRGRYVLQHPYGTLRFRAIAPREKRNVDVTIDRPCSIARGGRCAPRLSRWLRSTSPRREPGYIGTVRRTPVAGGPVRNNLVLFGPGGDRIGRNNLFRVVGKFCGPRCRTRARRAG
jgi:hypothetical protein